jgi:hypothetical protein
MMAMNSGIMTSFHEEDLWPLDGSDVSLFLEIKSELLDPLNQNLWIDATIWIELTHLLEP